MPAEGLQSPVSTTGRSLPHRGPTEVADQFTQSSAPHASGSVIDLSRRARRQGGLGRRFRRSRTGGGVGPRGSGRVELGGACVRQIAFAVGRAGYARWPVDSHFKRHFPSPEENADNRWIVILSAIFLHLKKTPITDLVRSRLRGSLAAEQMTGIGVGRASIQI